MAASENAPDQRGSAAKGQTSEEQLEDLRVGIARTIRWTFPLLFAMTIAVAAVLVVLPWRGFDEERTMDATVLATSVQVAFGMVIGFVCVYLGLMMTWFGIDAAYTLKGSLGTDAAKAEGALTSASPGLLFALAGIVLIAVSLHKRIEYQEGSFQPAGSITTGSNGDDGPVMPVAPDNLPGR